MRIKHGLVFTAITAAIFGAGWLATASGLVQGSVEVVGRSNQSVVLSLQEVSVSNDGLLAPSLASLYDGSLLGEIAGAESPRMEPTATRSYLVNAARTEALFAEEVTSGIVMSWFAVDSQANVTQEVIGCSTYSECAERLTESEELRGGVAPPR